MPPSAPTGKIAPWQFDRVACLADLDAFAALLQAKHELSERDDILPFFRTHPHLAALLGSYNVGATNCDRLGVEVGLYGEFVADVVAGDRSRRAYCFVEFEDAMPASLFARRARHGTDWSPRFSRGFNQIVDWLWLLDDQEMTAGFAEDFGPPPISIVALLVIGRDRDMSQRDRRRLAWRQRHLLVNSQHIYCYTFDDLLHDLHGRLHGFQAWAATAPE
jgi:Domain of unknown function (DUF4263)